MAQKHRKGIDLMKKVSDKQAADMRLIRSDASRRNRRPRQYPAM